MSHARHTALVTGANSGLGCEAAAQLAEDGWGTVILACRTVEKAEAAKAQLRERTGRDPFEVLAVDTSEVASAMAAAAELEARGSRIDFLLLNAGASKASATFTSAGHEITYASTLIGHHVLTMQALAAGLLAERARIVISGSEGARSNMPGMKVHDLRAIAASEFDGDLARTIASMIRLEVPGQKPFANMNEYVTAKLVVAWWAGGLAKALPAGMTVNAVSPGANLATSFARDAPAMLRYVMLPMMKLLGPMMGMDGPLADGARRYVDAFERDDEDTGHFYATAHTSRLVGPVGVQRWPEHFTDEDGMKASLAALTELTGVGVPVLVA